MLAAFSQSGNGLIVEPCIKVTTQFGIIKETRCQSDLPITIIIIIPDVGLEDGDVDVGVEAGLLGEVTIHAPELGVVAKDCERVQGIDEPVDMMKN